MSNALCKRLEKIAFRDEFEFVTSLLKTFFFVTFHEQKNNHATFSSLSKLYFFLQLPPAQAGEKVVAMYSSAIVKMRMPTMAISARDTMNAMQEESG